MRKNPEMRKKSDLRKNASLKLELFSGSLVSPMWWQRISVDWNRVPDGLFSYQKSQFGMENVGLFYDHLENFMAIWYIFSVLACLDQEKSGNPGASFGN
jgi:hypothetical protein